MLTQFNTYRTCAKCHQLNAMELEEAPQTAVARMTDSTGIQRPRTWKSWHGWPAPKIRGLSGTLKPAAVPKNGWLHGPYGPYMAHSLVAVQLVISGSYIVIQYIDISEIYENLVW